jgi:hypothetical protein
LYELWHEAVRFVVIEENNKKSLYNEVDEPYFPDVKDLKQDLLQGRIAAKRLLRHFLFSARAEKPREHLQKIFDRVLYFTYDDPDKQNIDSVNQILDMIYEQRFFGFHGKDKVDIAWEYVSSELFAKFCSFFDDAISVNTEIAVLHILEHGYSLDQDREIKGLSKELVERIRAKLTIPPQVGHITTSPVIHPQENIPTAPSTPSIVVPCALWNGKTPPAARDAMAKENYPPYIIAHILHTRLKITSKSRIATLLDTYPKKVTQYLAEAATMNIVDS